MDWLFSWQPLAACGGLYALMAIGYMRRGDPGMALAFAAYAVANLGFIWNWWRTS